MAESKSAALPLGDTPVFWFADYSEKPKKSKLFIVYKTINCLLVNNLHINMLLRIWHIIILIYIDIHINYFFMNFFKNWILAISLAWGLTWCNQKPPMTILEEIAMKRESIIASMNEILLQGNVWLQKNEKCSIIIIGKKQSIDVTLACSDELILRKNYPKDNWNEFQTQVSQIQVLDTNRLQTTSGCMVMQEWWIIIMNPPDCTPDLITPESGKRFTI